VSCPSIAYSGLGLYKKALRCLEREEKLNPPAPQAEAIRRKIRELKG
jgi:hypothetical protein